MNKKIRQIIDEIFGNETSTDWQFTEGGENDALNRILELEASGRLETPPPTNWSLDYLHKSVESTRHWYSRSGRLFIDFNEELVTTLMQTFSAQPSYARSGNRKSASGSPFLETTIGDESSEVKAKIRARHDTKDENLFGLEVAVDVPGRKWPHLAKVPVTISLADRNETQLSNAFGNTLFSQLPLADLSSLKIEVGPAPNL